MYFIDYARVSAPPAVDGGRIEWHHLPWVFVLAVPLITQPSSANSEGGNRASKDSTSGTSEAIAPSANTKTSGRTVCPNSRVVRRQERPAKRRFDTAGQGKRRFSLATVMAWPASRIEGVGDATELASSIGAAGVRRECSNAFFSWWIS